MKKMGLILCCLLLLTGCMESRELKERTIIEAVGIDREEGIYSLIFQKYEPSTGQGSLESSSSGSRKSRPVESEGRSISEAIDRVTHYNGNEVFLGNSTYIVMGEDLAKEGILQELHYFNGENEISPSTFLVVADGSAKELISAQAESKESSASTIRDILEQGQRNGVIGRGSIMDVMKRLVDDSASPYLPVISAIKEEKEGGEDSGGENKSTVFKITGMAVFDREKMKDIIPIDEAKGILWANDEIRRALLVVADRQLGILSAEIQDSKTKIETSVTDGIPSFHLNIECSAQLLEVIGENRSGILNKQGQKRAEQLFEEEIRSLTEEAIRRCFTEDQCDVFRFCDYVKRNSPEYWEQIKNRWKELMPDCKITVSVSCSLSKSGQQAME